MPDTRPDTPFVDGVCQACINAAARAERETLIDWRTRQADFEMIIQLRENSSGFDCIVPSSGGKDSHWQVLKLIELGLRPLVVTASTCHLTPIGRYNIDNLAKHATTIEVTPNRAVRAKLNRLGLEMVGDISWPEHVSIFTTPFRVAAAVGVRLIFYGENPQNQYGGPSGTEAAHQLTRRWRSEFGGFLGLRPSDLAPMTSAAAMRDYEMPPESQIEGRGIRAYFLGQFFGWDSWRNAQVAAEAGMKQELPTAANLWQHENLDNAQTGLHDHGMYRKYGYGRGCAQASIDVRAGRMTRALALDWVEKHDGLFPTVYAGVHIDTILDRLGMSRAQLIAALDAFTNWPLFKEGDVPFREPAF